MIPTLTLRELKGRFDKGDKPVLLDMKELLEYALVKLESSHPIPLDTLSQSVARLDRDAAIVRCYHRSISDTTLVLTTV